MKPSQWGQFSPSFLRNRPRGTAVPIVPTNIGPGQGVPRCRRGAHPLGQSEQVAAEDQGSGDRPANR